VYGGLLFGLCVSESTLARLLALIPLVATAAWSIYLLKVGSIRTYLKQKVRQYEAAVDADPMNFAARTKLAETLYELGEAARAMAEMEMAIQTAHGSAAQQRFTLKNWQEEERLRQSRNVLCYRCGHENEHGLRWCSRCGSALPIGIDPLRAFRRNLRQFAVIAVGLALAGVSFALLPPAIAFIPVVFSILCALGWTLLRGKAR